MQNVDSQFVPGIRIPNATRNRAKPHLVKIFNPRLCKWIELAFDLVALSIAWWATIYIRFFLNPYFPVALDRAQLHSLAPPLWAILAVWILNSVRTKSDVSEWPGASALHLVDSALIVSTVIIVVTFFSQGVGAPLSRSYVILFAAVSYITLVIGRIGASFAAGLVETKWPSTRRIAVLGDGETAALLLQQIEQAAAGFVNLAGVILPLQNKEPHGRKELVLGTSEQFAELVNSHGLEQVIFLTDSLTKAEVDDCSQIARRMGITVSRLIQAPSDEATMHITSLYGMHLVDSKPVRFTLAQQRAKRAFDVTISSLLLLLCAPLLLCCAALIKLTSSGPVLFRSRRVGKGGRYFTFLKFRSMHHNIPRDLVSAQNEKAGHLFKIRNDPRLTPVGGILRRSSLDELPQLINVIRGDMSLIGPRPLPVTDLGPDGMSKLFSSWAHQRSSVLPGITGLWQIRGRSNLSFDEMVELDSDYVKHWSLLLDLKILIATPIVVLTGRGAY